MASNVSTFTSTANSSTNTITTSLAVSTTTTSTTTSPIVSSSTSTSSTYVFTDLGIDLSDPKNSVVPDFWQLVSEHTKWSREVNKCYDSDNETVVGGSCTSGSGIELEDFEDSDVSMIFDDDEGSEGSDEEEEAPFAALLMAIDIEEGIMRD